MTNPLKPASLLSRRLRRLQDALGLSNLEAARMFGVPLRTYSGHLYSEHFPRGGGMAHFQRILSQQEKKLKLEPLQ